MKVVIKITLFFALLQYESHCFTFGLSSSGVTMLHRIKRVATDRINDRSMLIVAAYMTALSGLTAWSAKELIQDTLRSSYVPRSKESFIFSRFHR